MLRAIRNPLLFVALSAVAAATWLLSRPKPPELAVETSAPSTSRYYMRDAVILGTDAAGKVAYRIFATRADKPTLNQDFALSDVRVEYADDEEIPWIVTAARATISETRELVRLFEAALVSPPLNGGDPVVIETPELELYPKVHVARSNGPATYTNGTARLDATGFTADLKREQLELEGIHARLDR